MSVPSATLSETSQSRCAAVLRLIPPLAWSGILAELSGESLVALAAVNRRFREIVQTQLPYPRLLFERVRLGNAVAVAASLYGAALVELGCPALSDSDVVFLLKRCPNLSRLHLYGSFGGSGGGRSDQDLGATRMDTLPTDAVTEASGRLTDVGVRLLVQAVGTTLCELSLGPNAALLTAAGVAALAPCTALQRLALPLTLPPAAVAALPALPRLQTLRAPTHVAALPNLCAMPCLRQLALRGDIDAAALLPCARRCQSLVLMGARGVDSLVRALQDSAGPGEADQQRGALQHLVLEHTDASEALVRALAAPGPVSHALTHLSIASAGRLASPNAVSSDAPTWWTRLATACRALTSVDIGECGAATGAWVAALASLPAGLRSLRLDGCVRVDEAGVLALTNARQLQELRASGVPGITDRALGALVAACPALRLLDIADCTRVTQVGVRALARMAALRVLSLAGVTRVDDAAVELLLGLDTQSPAAAGPAAGASAPSAGRTAGAPTAGHPRAGQPSALEVLDLSRTGITDAALLTLSQTCARLQSLRLLGCDSVTDRGCMHLAHGCEALRVVLCDSPHVSGVGVRALRRGCPRLLVRVLERSLALAAQSPAAATDAGDGDDGLLAGARAADSMLGRDDVSLLGGTLPVRRVSARNLVARQQARCCELQ